MNGIEKKKRKENVLLRKHKTIIISFVLSIRMSAIYQSGPLDLPPGG
jgi:hypothetical protein